MPRIIRERDHVAAGQALIRKASSSVNTPDGKTSVSLVRDLHEMQRRADRPLEILSKLPFASGLLVEGVPLGGIRGRVADVSGPSLTLFDPVTVANFAVYDASKPFTRGARIVASSSDGTGGSLRLGSVDIASIDLANGVLVSGSGDWTTAITGLAVGDYLFDTKEWGAPTPRYDTSGKWTGTFTSGPVTRLDLGFGSRDRNNLLTGVFVLQSLIQPAVVWWLPSAEASVVNLGSRYACTADLWIF